MLFVSNSVLAQHTKNTAIEVGAQPWSVHCHKSTLVIGSLKIGSDAKTFIDVVYY